MPNIQPSEPARSLSGTAARSSADLGPAVVCTAALVAPLLVAWILSFVRNQVVNTNAALVLVLVVVAIAATGRRLAGALAALSATVWFDFFLTQPYHRLAIADRDDVETAVLLIVVGLAVTEITLWGRRQQGRSSRRQGHLEGIVSAAQLAASGQAPPIEVIDRVGRQIRDVLGIDGWSYEPGPAREARPTLMPDGAVVAAARDVDVDRSGLPTMDFIELPVTSHGVVLGRYLLTSASHVARPDAEQRRVAVALAEQVGAALSRPRGETAA